MRGRANTISEEKGEHYLAKAAQDAYHMTVVPMTRRKCAAEVNHIRELVGKLNLGSQDLLGSHELFAHAPLRTGKLQNGTDLRSFRSKNILERARSKLHVHPKCFGAGRCQD